MEKVQMNFEKGVNRKAVTSAATCGEAERGEAAACQKNLPAGIDGTAKAHHSSTNRPQMNFPNGS